RGITIGHLHAIAVVDHLTPVTQMEEKSHGNNSRADGLYYDSGSRRVFRYLRKRHHFGEPRSVVWRITNCCNAIWLAPVKLVTWWQWRQFVQRPCPRRVTSPAGRPLVTANSIRNLPPWKRRR